MSRPIDALAIARAFAAGETLWLLTDTTGRGYPELFVGTYESVQDALLAECGLDEWPMSWRLAPAGIVAEARALRGHGPPSPHPRGPGSRDGSAARAAGRARPGPAGAVVSRPSTAACVTPEDYAAAAGYLEGYAQALEARLRIELERSLSLALSLEALNEDLSRVRAERDEAQALAAVYADAGVELLSRLDAREELAADPRGIGPGIVAGGAS